MEKIEKQQQYTFEEFDQHVSLWNMIPAGQGNSLVLLRKLVDGCQSGSFNRIPSLLVVGESADAFSRAVGNSLCSNDIRGIDAKYLTGTSNQMNFFGGSLSGTVHIISNPEVLGLNESVLWYILQNREYKFKSFDQKDIEHIHVNGMIILCVKDIKLVSPQIIKAVDFKVVIESYSQPQLELLVHQRLKFCGIDYGDDEKVLKIIIEFGCNQLSIILYLLKICILVLEGSSEERLTPNLIQKASRLI